MKLHFYGADRCVTGSCHCLEINGKKILVDCGLQQGRDELDNRYLAFAPGNIDILLVTHAHIDHTGRIPLLVKNGFHGRILTTRLTADLMKIMLLDSAHIQESDAEYENRKGERAGREHVDPLYTEQDALDVFKYVTTCEYKEKVDLCEGVSAVFTDAGHLLGSASITLELEENGVHKTIVFSGDIGNVDQPIIRDPQLLKKADYVVMESTYGDRNHTEVWSYTDELAEIIDETLGKGGNVVIPSFAVGRTQELLYFIREIKDQKLVKSTPNFPVYIDSPLAKAATTVFCGDLHGYLDEQALELVKDGTHMFTFPNLNLVESSEESKMLNMDTTPKVIISASAIPGNEVTVGRVINELFRKGATVVYDRADMLHVSGHACQEELKIIHALTKPRFFVPLHGEQRMLQIHCQLAQQMGMDRNHIAIADNGGVIEITGKSMKLSANSVPAGEVYVDGSGVGDVGAVVMRDRKRLAEDGMVVVVLPIATQDGALLSPPEIITRGFIYVKESGDLMKELQNVAMNAADSVTGSRKRGRDDGELRGAVKSAVSSYLFKNTKRSPMVIPVVTRL